MEEISTDVVVAGHICLDVIPTFDVAGSGLEGLLTPGQLVEVGPAVTSTGGAVSNTGLALYHLGVRTRLMGKIGDDIFGQAILEKLRTQDEELARGMIVGEGESSSYTVVISPPDVDRVFLHSPGANNSYRTSEISMDRVRGTRLFHFGYPPIMREIYTDGGRSLAELFAGLQEEKIVTSLDMAQPDPDSEAGAVDWKSWLERVLPHTNIYAPSFEETLFMLDRARFDRMQESAGNVPMVERANGELLARLGQTLLEMGATVVALKLGDQGLYLRTSSADDRFKILEEMLNLDIDRWSACELLIPCFATDVAGTTGAGDTTVAGLLAGLIHGQSPESAITSAVGVGAFSVEAPDAVSGVPDWETVQTRIGEGWDQLPLKLSLPGWRWDQEHQLMRA
jgi:sugar/nucleoside kinase (ribokinase family)